MRKYIYLVTLIGILVSCVDDKNKITADQLVGNLQIKVAKRNGKVTKLLSGGYFDFENTNTMFTNIKGDTITHNYTLKNKKVITTGQDPMEFEIVYISADTIILTSKIGKSTFEFLTIKE